MNIRLFYLLGSLVILTACSIHKIDIQQGNVMSADVVAQVKPGMSRDQVQFLLGDPMIKHPFDQNRWDYPFSFQAGKKGTALEHYQVTVFFDGDRVERVVSDLPAEP